MWSSSKYEETEAALSSGGHAPLAGPTLNQALGDGRVVLKKRRISTEDCARCHQTFEVKAHLIAAVYWHMFQQASYFYK